MGRHGRDGDEAEGFGATRVWTRDIGAVPRGGAPTSTDVPRPADAGSTSRRARRRGGPIRRAGRALWWRIALWVVAFGVGWWLGGIYFG